ncbi:sigma-70 family RNA polymerase sigma factor [Clostridium botulinum]|uniref:Sigma-70 family RNA polymerase sigma factor n=1 Tax=Clostridium botulinum TaxID=1491 RepID=A0A6G4CQU6_CLOBO|nr:sigma-70 family RNA polymerase sigma factor [Clostridium botulinum]NEZ98404.1 sigma-70 family RNA polymerase sigma factor [Clostridium botulinum]NFA30037.1 sigma-70 family RNA polymerase sigma factor [Clostridium botulinum]NFA85709.1 sigma-70 family RNA polymerase sigma factor [Clostridium botulinum]NFB05076.1 sigma-70 family RNA polymerase sigma factor [Clostridium botulinum]
MSMKLYKRHKEHVFDSYCKKIIKNEARNIYTEINIKNEREISLEQLTIKDINKITVFPEYFLEDSSVKCNEEIIQIKNEDIMEIIMGLSEKQRSIIIFSYCFNMSDRQIAEELNLVRRTVSRYRNKALLTLRKSLEEKMYEKEVCE